MKKPKRTRPAGHDTFVFKLARADPRYFFSLNHDKHTANAYDESLSLGLVAECLFPPPFAGREAKISLLAKVGTKTAERSASYPTGVASITAGKSRLELLGHLPSHDCWALAAAVNAGSLRFLVASGEPLFRGKLLVWTMMFAFHVDLDDY